MNIELNDKPILSWNNISYSVPNLDILKSINGYAVGGRLLSIMGASGSGKTTFLDVLCDRTKGGNLNCNISLNGINVNKNRSKLFSYVTQDDQLLNSATVRETLRFAALLRISNINEDELTKRVDTVLDDLGIMHRSDSLIGGGEIKGLSGGEKRRVSIGQELVCTTSPLLCLDEPTTGLDSFTALNVMSCLKDLTKNKNVIVLATIHQPNSNISSLFDDLMIMNKGECVYFGRFDDAVDRFNKVGLTCPIYNNPCDFFISIIDNDDNSQLLFNSQNNWFQSLCTDNFNNDNIDCENHELLYIKMIQSNKTELNSINNESNNNDINKENEAYATSFIHQSKILTIRSWRQWLRDPGMFMSELVQYSFLGFFLGGLYYNVNLKLESGVYDRTFSLFFLLAVLIFTPPFTAISTFALERSLFRKERLDKQYRVSSWLLAKTLTVFPMEAILCFVFSLIVYLLVGFQYDIVKFLIFFVIVLIFQLCAESLGLLFAIMTESPIYAIVWLSLILIVILSLTGFLTYSMPVYYVWIMDVNIMRFTLLALLINEFDGLEFIANDGTVVAGLNALPTNMQPSLSLISYVGILLGFLFFLRLLLLICLIINEKENFYQYYLNKLSFGMIGNDSNNEYNSINKDENKDENNIELNKIDVIVKD